MDKKILFTLLLITSLILFLGCTNLGIEVTCPDGEVVNDIRDCVDENKLIPTQPKTPPRPTQKTVQAITTCQELQNITDLTSNYILENNIDCTDTINWNNGAGFAPLATFTGTLNGQGFTITDLYINRPTSKEVGLFSRTNNATITNLGIANTTIIGKENVGGLIGRAENTSVDNIHYSGEINGWGGVGGIIARGTNTTITNSSNAGTITSSIIGHNRARGTGGITGYCDTCIISKSYNTGNIYGNKDLGGIAGQTQETQIMTVYNTGDINWGHGVDWPYFFGGIVGTMRDSTIRNAYNTGTIYGNSYGSGIAGYMQGDIAITNVYNRGHIIQINESVGGLIGGLASDSTLTLSNSYNVGPLQVLENIRDIGGIKSSVNPSTSTLENNYWDKTLTGANYCYKDAPLDGSCIPTDNEEARYFTATGIPFTELGFDGDWKALPNDHPIFAWQDNPPQNDPYKITNCEELQNMNNDLTGNYTLENDIDCTNTINWNNGAGFAPIRKLMPNTIPNINNSFTGTLNGNNYKIYNLYINRNEPYGSPNHSDGTGVGLIGFALNATITNIGLIDQNINGYHSVGGLIGIMNDTIVTQNYTTGTTNGFESVGGLIGFSENGLIQNNYTTGNTTGVYSIGGLIGERYHTIIQNNYTTGNITGTSLVGGLIGYTNRNLEEETIQNNYAAVNVIGVPTTFEGEGTLQPQYISGLIGEIYNGPIINNYWDITLTGQTNCYNQSHVPTNTGCTSTNNEERRYFRANGIPFTQLGFDGNWKSLLNDHPIFAWQETPPQNDPYKITDCTELQNMNQDLNGNYTLENDIDCAGTINWNNGAGFEPIVAFTGTLLGNNHTINDLFINRPTESQVGLFKSIQNAKITKITLENANITGSTDVGTIAGRSTTSTLENTYVIGNVNSTSTTQLTRTGGLIGYVTVGNTQISYSSFNGTITSNGGAVGGIVGVLDGGTITGAHTNGTITGAHNYAGGITSYVNWTSSIQDSYSTANVTGRKYVGGLVGTIDKEGPNAIINCFATGAVTGTQYVGGLIGEHYRNQETITNNYYNNTADNPSTCIGIGNGECTTITNNETYFYNSSNPPLANWDFTNIWTKNTNSYPTLK
jgi:mucin-19